MQKQGECSSEKKLVIVLFALSILIVGTVPAQFRIVNSLSRVDDHVLPAHVRFPTLLNFSSRQFSDLLYFDTDSAVFIILKNNGNGNFDVNKIIGHSLNITSVTVGNINNDGIDDIVVIHRDQNQLEVFLSRAADSTYLSSSFTVNFYPEHAVIGDITNDKIPDIISYGKLSSGVSVLQGKGNGKFQPFKILFENVPVSEFALIALNADNISDVALHNWLSNETTLYLGIGKLKFSEQTELSFSSDTVQTLFSDFTKDGIVDIAVLSVQNKTLQILHGDGLGNFSFSQATPIYDFSVSPHVGSFTRSQTRDIIIPHNTKNSFSILLNRTDGTFYDEIIFGMPNSSTDLLSGDINGDGLTDVVLIDNLQNQYSVLWNSQTNAVDQSTKKSFAVGGHPNNIYVNDINYDGKDDILVSNSESSTVSVLLSRGNMFSGQVSIEIPENPIALSLYSKSDSSITMFTTHQDNPKISIVSLRKEMDSTLSLTGEVEQFSIALPEKPVNILPDISYMQKGISLYAFMSSSTNAIVFYQQVKGTRFLAKSLVPLVPAKIIYSTINDLNDDGKTDLLYVYWDEQVKSGVLGITMNDSTNEFKGKVFTFSLPDSSIRKAFVFIEDVNGDQIKDCLVYSSPENILRLALGSHNTLFDKFSNIIGSISLKNPDQLQLYDYDNDGILDILVSDETGSNEVSLFRGKGNGKFFPKSKIADIPSGACFRCGDFNGDSNTDLVYTNSKKNSVTVIYGSNK